MSAIAGLSQILSGLALAGFTGVTLWLLMRPRARMAALIPAPRWQVAAPSRTICTTSASDDPGE